MTTITETLVAAGAPDKSWAMSIPVPKIGESVIVNVPAKDVEAWLYMGLARVLGDAHAGIKVDDYADKEALRAAVVAAIQKRFDGGPGGNRAPAGSRDLLTEEVTRIMRAKLKAAKIDVKELKGHQAHREAFQTLITKLGGTPEHFAKAQAKIISDAEAIVAARAAAEKNGPSLDDLIS